MRTEKFEICSSHNYVQLDRSKLQAAFKDYPIPDSLVSDTPVHLEKHRLNQMARIISSIERVCALPAYHAAVLEKAPGIARHNFGPRGVLMGYDFHLQNGKPKLIEINTNAGGALINQQAINAQQHCCKLASLAFPGNKSTDSDFVQSFISDWKCQREDQQLQSIAIVDNDPEQQFLYNEFLIFKHLFEQEGITAIIADPRDLQFREGKLFAGNTAIDLVYNRSTDFYFEHSDSYTLRQAYENNRVVVTPNPHLHAIYANKENLTLLSNSSTLQSLGADPNDIELLSHSIPCTTLVSEHNVDELWARRKELFFKPADGYGSKAVYRGNKITRKVWQSIQSRRYVAQLLVTPDLLSTGDTSMKTDYRNYSYNGKVQLVTARLYQGQTTNMRTAGGGYSPILAKRFSLPCCS